MTLPPCSDRSDQPEPGRYLCRSPSIAGTPREVSEDSCQRCPYSRLESGELSDHAKALRAGWGAKTAQPARDPVHQPCVHLGQPTGALVDCPTCKGNVREKVMICSIHIGCTIGRQVEGHACCATCPDYRPP